MRQHKAYRAYRPRAKAARLDRPNETAITVVVLLVISGLFIGQLLLLIGP